MPFEMLMETAFTQSSGSSSMHACSQTTDANLKLPISYRDSGMLPCRTSNSMYVKRNVGGSCSTEYSDGEPSNLSACWTSYSVPG